MEKNNGSKLWKKVPYPGRPPSYTPESLWEKFNEYMEHNKDVSWDKHDFIKSGPDAGRLVTVAIPNPPSIRGFCVFAGIVEDTFRNYSKLGPEYLLVWHTTRDIIQEIQISGAATNTFNANIIARWAGLIDKKELDIKSEMTDDERSDAIRLIMEKMKKS
jgi:hypothetical protein